MSLKPACIPIRPRPPASIPPESTSVAPSRSPSVAATSLSTSTTCTATTALLAPASTSQSQLPATPTFLSMRDCKVEESTAGPDNETVTVTDAAAADGPSDIKIKNKSSKHTKKDKHGKFIGSNKSTNGTSTERPVKKIRTAKKSTTPSTTMSADNFSDPWAPVIRRAAASSALNLLQKVAEVEDSDNNSEFDRSDSEEDNNDHNETSDLTDYGISSRDSSMMPTITKSRSTSTSGSGRRKIPLKAVPLDYTHIRRNAPAIVPDVKRERLFGLEHCPIFYPTIEEFAHPLEYIERIAQQSRDHEYGICKVVPPEGWHPPFSLNEETFRFGTRMQRLNSLEASARANLNFIEQLTIFHRQQKHSKFGIPIVCGKPLDLWRLRKEVTAEGGFDVVCEQRKWSQVGRAMGLDPKTDHGLTAVLRNAFQNIVQPFEDYRMRVKMHLTPEEPGRSGSSTSSTTMRSMASMTTMQQATPVLPQGGKASLSAIPVTLEQVQAASAKLNDALQASPASKVSPSTANIPMGKAFSPDGEEMIPGDYCELCMSLEDAPSMLLCDECDRGYHLHCLNPPLKEVPADEWICDACIISHGDDFGFEEGDDHTLGSFQQRARKFKTKWLDLHPVPGIGNPEKMEMLNEDWEKELLIEDHVEREFWRLVESPDDTVEVEYGADIHTTKWGSAIPTIESDPSHPYARDGWNLTNLPILPGSVLRYVKSDICGMTVPWAYVGMIFSTFAWHKEDHNTYSVNYHHIGGTKTWYGVPGDDDHKLEAAMQAAAPELFEQQPDLMYQLVTLMSPGRLKEAGVRVSVCDQRPNEFVITFPKAFHAGFNHDFNYNEAVNFCLPDWLTSDLEGVKRYKQINKAPVFSHDELMMTIYSYEKTPKSSQWLLPLFEEMVQRELQERAQAIQDIPDLQVVQEDIEADDEHYQCIVDKSFCYLSQVTTEGHSSVSCSDHWKSLPDGKKIMKVRLTDEDLKAMLARVRQRANVQVAEQNAERVKRKTEEAHDAAVVEAKRMRTIETSRMTEAPLSNHVTTGSMESMHAQGAAYSPVGPASNTSATTQVPNHSALKTVVQTSTAPA